MVASAWSEPEKMIRTGRPDPWSVLDARLRAGGGGGRAGPGAWVKQADPEPGGPGRVPQARRALKDDLAVDRPQAQGPFLQPQDRLPFQPDLCRVCRHAAEPRAVRL